MTIDKNKTIVQAFYQKALNDRDADAARSSIGTTYHQHNPLIGDGLEGLHKYQEWISAHYPKSHNEVLRVFAEGDYVILHVHRKRTPEARGDAIVDIFRLENGKIVEHWDVIQPVPKTSANPNTMF
ncbi:MAG: nuclear transport factor 2 family protein [Rhizomicrobium sp.]